MKEVHNELLENLSENMDRTSLNHELLQEDVRAFSIIP